jgi:hypothetical protein
LPGFIPGWSEIVAQDLSTAVNNCAVMSHIKVLTTKWEDNCPDLSENQKEIDIQIEFYKKAIETDPKNYQAHLNLHLTMWQRGDITDRGLIFNLQSSFKDRPMLCQYASLIIVKSLGLPYEPIQEL